MPTVFVRQLSLLTVVLGGGGNGTALHVLWQRFVCVCLFAHMCPFLAPKSIQPRETVIYMSIIDTLN